MDFSLKEALGLTVSLVVTALVLYALLKFEAFNMIGEIIEGVL